jgi:hypothetical protein
VSSSALGKRLAALEAADLARRRAAFLADHTDELGLHAWLTEAGVLIEAGPPGRGVPPDFTIERDPDLPEPDEHEERCLFAGYLLNYAYDAWPLFAAPGGEQRLQATMQDWLDLPERDLQQVYDHTLAACRRYDLVEDGA